MPPFRLLLAAALLAACQAPASRDLVRQRLEVHAMGTTFGIQAWARTDPATDAALAAAAQRIHALDAALSDYDPGSELSRLCDRSADGPTGPVPVSADLFRVLAHAQEVARSSGGAFDVTVGPFVRLWRQSVNRQALPRPERLATARAAVGWQHLTLDPAQRTVALGVRGMRLDLGGIAKGYALDEALAVLAEHGIERALVDGGGDVAASGPPPGAAGWRIAFGASFEELELPTTWLELAHAAVATSGDMFQVVEIDGVFYSHVVDPRTGLGVTSRAAASVVAPAGMQADALASALCVLGAPGLALIERGADLEARVVTPSRTARSSGWDALVLR